MPGCAVSRVFGGVEAPTCLFLRFSFFYLFLWFFRFARLCQLLARLDGAVLLGVKAEHELTAAVGWGEAFCVRWRGLSESRVAPPPVLGLPEASCLLLMFKISLVENSRFCGRSLKETYGQFHLQMEGGGSLPVFLREHREGGLPVGC